MSTVGTLRGQRPIEAAYGALLRLYPTDFRHRYAHEMVLSLRERLRDPRHQGSLAARGRLAALLLEDLLRSIPREHVLAWRRRGDRDPARQIRSRRSASEPPSSPPSPRSRLGMDTVLQDLLFAARTLRGRPSFTAVVVATLALGIGATTMIFSVLDGVVIRALPYPDSERIVMIGSESELFSSFGPVSPFAFREWQASNEVFETMAAASRQDLDLTGRGNPQRLQAAAVSSEYFGVLGTAPRIGRGLTAEDNEPGAPRVVVISHGLWQRSWGGDEGVVGGQVTLNGEPWAVVGVLPPEFLPPEALNHRDVDLWFPLVASGIDLDDRGNFLLRVVAKLRPGISLEASRHAMSTLAWALENEDQGQTHAAGGTLAGPSGAADEAGGNMALAGPSVAGSGNVAVGAAAQDEGDQESEPTAGAPRRFAVSIGGDQVHVQQDPVMRVAVATLKERTVGDSSGTLVTLAGAVGFLLLIACANVANLLLARSGDRMREVAVRVALGAGRRRIVRQLLTESILLGLAGGLGGAVLAVMGVAAFLGFNPGDLPRLQQVGVDLRVLGFTFLVSVATGVLFGIVPALSLARGDVGEALKEGGAASQGSGRARCRGLMVVAETALALVLLVGAGLMINSFVRLTSVDPGFEPDNLLAMQVEIGDGYQTPGGKTRFFRELMDRVAAIPGVESVGMTSLMPFTGLYTMSNLEIENPVEAPDLGADWVGMHQINADYFDTMRMRFVAGRAFNAAEAMDGAGGVVVNETFAMRFWGDREVIGRRLRLGGPDDGAPWRTVVGVIADIKQFSLAGPTRPDLYMPYEGSAGGNRVHVAARLGLDPAAVAPALRQAVWDLDPTLPVDRLSTMRELISGSVDEPRFYAALLGTFAAVALLLAAVGIYGTVAYNVGQRTRELGIRSALGAGAADLLLLVTRHGMALVLVGVGLGVLGAYWLSGFVSGFLYDVAPTDGFTFVLVGLGLALIGLAACVLPARRATHVDPMLALRSE